MVITIRRVYDIPEEGEGFRILVDRLWPRGISREKAGIGLWAREIAPSDSLRKWYSHDPEKYEEFRRLYREELSVSPLIESLLEKCRETDVVLLYSSRVREGNNANVLMEYLEELLTKSP